MIQLLIFIFAFSLAMVIGEGIYKLIKKLKHSRKGVQISENKDGSVNINANGHTFKEVEFAVKTYVQMKNNKK